MSPELLPLLAVVCFAFAVESALGFGSTVVTVGLASLWLPLDGILPVFVPVNLLLSGYLVLRYRQHVSWRFMGTRVMPFMALGLPIGFVAFAYLAGNGLKLGLGLFIVVLSVIELRRLAVQTLEPQAALHPFAERLALVGGGIAHGAFASGGPLAVWVSGRVLLEKASFRASLSLLWLALNLALVAGYVLNGQIDAITLRTSAMLVPSLAVGLVVGEWAHSRIPLKAFRVGIFALLLVVGALLVMKG